MYTFCITRLSNTYYKNKGYRSLNLKIPIFKLEIDICKQILDTFGVHLVLDLVAVLILS